MSDTEVMEIKEPVKPAQVDAPVTEPTAWMPLTDEMRNSAPDTIKDLIAKKGYTSLDQFFGSYTELEKFKGIGKHLVIPEPDDVQGWDNVYKQLGRPESADKYEFTNETGVEISDELMTGFKAFAHKEGYTQKQLAGAIQFQLDAVKASDEIFKTQSADRLEKNVLGMKTKWGEAQYQPTIDRIDETMGKLKVLDYFRELGIDKDPEVVNLFLTIANSEAEEIIGKEHPKPPEKTAQQELAEIMASEAFKEKFHADHKKILGRYMELNKIIANAGQGQAPRT